MTNSKPRVRVNTAGVITDGFANLVAGLGAGNAKTSAHTYVIDHDQMTLENAYRVSTWFGKIVDIPADDATREWRTWKADKQDIERIEAEEKRLQVRQQVRQALIWARLYGGAVMQRLSFSDRELARAGASVLALPQHASLGARLVWETADAIWDGLGDRSEDVNWYSKRATLSAVWGATVLYWLGDDSPELHDTRDFLDRRIEGVMRFETLKGRIGALPGVSVLTELATGWIKRPERRNLPGDLRGAARRHEAGGGRG